MREFYPKLILIGELLKIKKIKIYFYRGRSIFKHITYMKNIIYFDKSLSNSKIKFHKKIINDKNILLSLDEEGPIYNWDSFTRKGRLPKKIISNSNKIFLYGNYEKNFVEQKSKFYVTGHPKYDLLKREILNKVFNKEIKYIKKKYNNFILISSSFTQDVKGGYENYLRYLKKIYDSENKKKHFNTFLNYQKNDNENYQELINFTIKLAQRFPKKKIIFRPHPSQDVNKVKSRFPDDLKNINIIKKFQITPWIDLCNTYVHSHCTTSYEAAILKKNIITIIKNHNTEHKFNPLRFKIGNYFTNASSALSYFSKKIKNNKIRFSKNYIWNNDLKNLSSRRISKFIEKNFGKINSELNIIIKKKKKVLKPNLLKRLVSKLKIFLLNYKIFIFIDNIISLPENWFLHRDYKNQKFDQFKLKEIKDFFAFYCNRNINFNIGIKKISNEVIEIKNFK